MSALLNRSSTEHHVLSERHEEFGIRTRNGNGDTVSRLDTQIILLTDLLSSLESYVTALQISDFLARYTRRHGDHSQPTYEDIDFFHLISC